MGTLPGGHPMICTSCGETNRESARFCADCGTPMHLTCGGCDATLSPRAKFCDQCGTPVGPAAPAAPSTAASDDEAVRKTITIVFADLVGSTSFQEKVDAETTRAEMAAYQQVAQDVVERHGGTVAKFIGDGVMAVFGVPDVAEDDADRAVRSGVALQAAFAPIAERIRGVHGVEVGLRVGINSGEIVVADDDDDMFGDALNTAARIEAECTPGRVLVGEQTWRLTRSAVTYEVLGEVTLKGKEDPVATFQVVEAPEKVDEIQTPFVGRDHEINALIEAVDASIEERSPVLVTVIGSPGVGKTRLAAEARAVAAPHAQTFDLRVDRAATSTFGPVADLVRRVIDVDESAEPAQVVDRIAEWIGADASAAELAPVLATFIGAGPARSTEESFWASRRLIEILAHHRPTLIVVDDIQWAQPLFLDLLDHLVEWVTGPAALICLARPEIREIRPALAETGRRVYDVVSLEGLAAGATAELAAGLLGADELPGELADRLPESTDGNPLFVRELVRMLVDDGVVEQVGGTWQLAIDPDAVEVPPTIQSLLASRVERMPPDERRVVELASVVGSEFARGAIAALLPEAERPGLDALLERLRRKEIIDPTGNYWGDEPILRFHHVLIRDASYRRMLKQRRADLHVAVGEWTADAADRFGGEHEISIGFHYEQAHLLLTELGRVDDATDLGRRAATLFRIAGERALAQDDLAAAGSLASRALACIDGPRHERAALLLIACEAFLSAGNVHEGEPHLAELRELVADDDRLSAWADAFEGQRIWATDPERLNEIQPVVAAAAERLADLGDDAGVAKARFVQAIVLARLGRVGDCEAELDAALTAARAADDRRRVTAVLGAAPQAALWGPSPVARAGGRCLDIIRLLRITSASPMVEATSVRCQAVLEAMRGRFEQARDLIARSRETVEELGLRHGILETAMYAGIIELYADQPEAAEPFLREAKAGLGRLGVGADAGQAAALLSEALLAQGRVDEAAELADESVRLAGQNQRTAIASRAAQARIAVAQGRLDDAAALAQEAVDLAAATDLTMDHARAASTLALVHDRQGRSSSAAADAAALFEAKGAQHSALWTPPTPPAAPAHRHELTNLAVEATVRACRHIEDPAVPPAPAVATYEMVDRRDAGVLNLDRDQFSAGIEEARAADVRYTVTPIEIRGETLALVQMDTHWRRDGVEESALVLAETDDRGRNVRTTLFDVDDLVAAHEALSEAWQALGGDAVPELENTATRVVIEGTRRVNDGEPPGPVAPNWSMIDRRAVGSLTVDDDSRASLFYGPADQRPIYHLTPLAVRGDRCALLRAEGGWRNADIDGDLLIVSAVDAGDLTETTVLFDPDDLRSAISELNRLYVEGEGAAFAEPLRLTNLLGIALMNRDYDRLAELFTPDADFIDGRVTKAAYDPAQFAALAETQPADTLYVSRYAAINEHGLVCETVREWTEDGSLYTETGVRLIVVRDGLITRYEGHPAEALPDVLARFEELTVDDRLANEATRWSQRGAALVSGGDFDPPPGYIAEDFLSKDHRFAGQGDGDAATQGEAMAARSEFGTTYESTPVAIRGDHHALMAWRGTASDGFTSTTLTVIELDATGAATRNELFSDDRLDDAIATLDALFAATQPADIQATLELDARYGAVFSDPAAARELVTDDFRFVDHAEMTQRELTMDDWAALQTDPSARLDVSMSYLRRYHRLEPGGWLGESIIGSTDAAGNEVERESLLLQTQRDGLVARIEVFPPDQLDAAIARFDELTTTRPRLWNAAVARAVEAAALITANGAGVGTFRTDDYRMIDRRAGSAVDLDAASGPAFAQQLAADGVTVATIPVAVRGDRVALVRVEMTHGEGQPDDAWLLILQLHVSGNTRLNVLYDLADLRAALDELNRLYLEDEGEPYREIVAVAESLREATEQSDPELYEDRFAPDVVFVDNRTLGVGALDRNATLEYAEVVGTESAGRSVVPAEYLRISAGAMLTRRIDHEVASGSDSEWETLVLLVAEGGRAKRIEFYSAHDEARAIARFEELTAGTSQLNNLAIEWSDRNQRLMVEGRVDESRAQSVDDFELTDHRFAGQGDDADSAIKARLEMGAQFTHDAIATRGDRFALTAWNIRSPEGFETVVLCVVEVNHEGLGVRVAQFDESDLAAAEDLLDEWFAQSLPAVEQDHFRTWGADVRIYEAGDPTSFAQSLPDNLTVADHRTGGFGTVDRAGWIERFVTFHDIAPNLRIRHPAVHRVSATVILSTQLMADENGNEWTFVVLAARPLDRFELFDLDDLAVAERRFDELVAASSPRALENAASRALRRYGDALAVDRDINRALAWWSDDAVFYDHTLVTRGVRTKPDMEDWLADVVADRLMRDTDITVMATRGDQLCLGLDRVDLAADGFDKTWFSVAEVDDDGRLTRIAAFDLADEDAAWVLLDDWFSESLPTAEGKNVRSWSVLSRLLGSGDEEAFAALLPDTITVTDHRPAGFGTMDRNGWFETIRSLHDVAPRLTVRHTVVHAVSAAAVLTTQSMDDGEGNEWSLLCLAAESGGLLEFFAIGDLFAAERRFDELAAAETVGGDATTEFERFWARFDEAIAARDWSRLDTLVSPELTGRSNRLGWGGWEYTAEGLVTILRETIDMFDTPDVREVLSVLGGNLALVHWHAEADENTFDLVSLMEVNSGVLTRIDTWDAEDLVEAYEALAAAFRPSLPEPERRVLDATVRSIRAFSESDSEALRASSPKTWVDRRAGEQNFGTIDRDAFVERQRTLWDMSPGAISYGRDLHALSASGILGTTTVVDGAGNRWDMLMLVTFADSQPVEGEIFDLADLDTALARFDELTAVEQSTTAERVTAELTGAINAEQWEEVAALVADDFHHRSARVGFGGTELDKELFIASVRHSLEMFGVGRVETVTTRGDRIAVHRFHFGGGDIDVDYLLTQQFDASGQLERSVSFDLDGLSRALETADAWHLESVPTATSGPALSNAAIVGAQAWEAALNNGDAGALRTLCTPDMQFEDHRGVGSYDSPSLDDAIASNQHFVDQGAGYTITPLAVRGERLGLVRTNIETGDGFRVGQYVVGGVDDAGLFTFMSFHSEDDRPSALRRLRDLWLAGEAEPHRAVIEATDRMGAAFRRPGGDELAAAVTSDFVLTDRRNIGFGEMTIERYIETVPEIQQRGDLSTYPAVYHRVTNSGLLLELRLQVDTADAAIELADDRLVLFTVRGDLVSRMEWFDIEDLAAAEARFDDLTQADERIIAWRGDHLTVAIRHDAAGEDRIEVRDAASGLVETFASDELIEANRRLTDLYAATVDDETARVLVGAGAITERLLAGDAGGLRQLFADDFRAVVHQLFAVPENDRDGFIETMMIWVEQSEELFALPRTVDRADANGFVWTHAVEGRDETGALNEWIGVNITLFEDGKVTYWEEWPPGNLETALARFDGLTGASETVTTSQQVGAAVLDAMNEERWDDLASLVADDYHAESTRAGLGGTQFDKKAFLRGSKEMRALFGPGRETPIGTRGDRISLHRFEAGDEGIDFGYLYLQAVNDEGVAQKVITFDLDDILTATETLDQWHLETLPPSARAAPAAWYEIAHAFRRQDVGRVRDVTHPDLVVIDNRHDITGFSQLDRDAFIERQEAMWQVADAPIVDGEFVRANEHGTVVLGGMTDSAGNRWDLAIVLLVRDGKVHHQEFFDATDLDRAIARFDELTGSAPANRAATAMAEGFAARAALNTDRAIAAWHEDARGSDLRPLFNRTRMTKTHAAERVKQVREESSDDSLRCETSVLATRGDDLALVSTHFLWDSREFEVTRLDVVKVDDDGLIVRWCTFDPDQHEEALATLDRWAAAGDLVNDALDAAARFWHLVLALGDAEGAAALNGPEFETVDRRRLVGGQDLDADGARIYTELVRTREPGSVTHQVDAIDTDGEDRALYRLTARSNDGTWSYDHIQAIELDPDGLARRVTTYSPEDEQRALTEFRATDDLLHNDASAWAIANHPELADAEVIAVSDGRAAVLRTVAPSPELHVASVDEARGGTLASYAPEDFEAVRTDFHRRTIAALPEPERTNAEAMAEFGAGQQDPERMVGSITDDFVVIDHRELGTLTVEADQVREYRSAHAEAGQSLAIARRALARRGPTALLEWQEVTDDYEWRSLTLFHVVDGKVALVELWDTADTAAALARFEELSAEPAENAAARVAFSAWSAMYESGDFDAMAAQMEPTMRLENRMQLVAHDLDRAGMIEYLQRVGEESGAGGGRKSFTWRFELIASKGDRHCLHDNEFQVDGITQASLVITEIGPSGLATRTRLFDHDRREEALAEMERMAAEVAPPHNRAAEIVIEENRQLYVDKIVSADMRSTLLTFDYSPFRSFDLNDDAIFQQWFDEMVEPYEIELTASVLDTVGDHLVLVRISLDVEGVDFPVELLQLSRTDDEQSRQTALFDVAAEDTARALLADWVAADADPSPE